MLKLTILFFLILGSSTIHAQEYICETVKSQGEGHWPIPEERFTKENAEESIESLNELLDLPIGYIDDIESIKHNTFIFIKGYLLKRRIIENTETDSLWVSNLKNDFCEFLKNEAYISH